MKRSDGVGGVKAVEGVVGAATSSAAPTPPYCRCFPPRAAAPTAGGVFEGAHSWETDVRGWEEGRPAWAKNPKLNSIVLGGVEEGVLPGAEWRGQ